jgi:hypothetical protein
MHAVRRLQATVPAASSLLRPLSLSLRCRPPRTREAAEEEDRTSIGNHCILHPPGRSFLPCARCALSTKQNKPKKKSQARDLLGTGIELGFLSRFSAALRRSIEGSSSGLAVSDGINDSQHGRFIFVLEAPR